jgi:hemolysin activation/secretion protein
MVQVAGAEVRGSTAYPAGHFAALLAPLTGEVAQSQIEDARAEILAAYRADGYLFTAVTVARDAAKRVVFSVTEGRIVEVMLDGDIGPAGVQVLRFLNHVVDVSPIDIATLERWLLLAQSVPGVTLRTVLRPSIGDPGAMSLVAQVSRKAFSGLQTGDNRGYSGTGPEEFVTSRSANSFTEFGERTDLTIFYGARTTQVFGQAATELFLGGSGLKLRLYAGHGTTDPSGALAQIGYHGDTTLGGALITYPAIVRRQQTLNAVAAFDVLDGTVDTSMNGATTLASRDSLRVLRLGGDYALHDVVLGGDRAAVSTMSLRLSRGLDGLGASPQGDLLASRLGERMDFTKVSFEVGRTQMLFSPWQDASFALRPTVAGQYSHDVLPSAEEFFLGGLRFNRGFYSGQVGGDRALTVDIEAQLNTGFSVSGPTERFDLGVQFYTFYDWGRTWQSQVLDRNALLVSAGAGARMMFPHGVELDVEGVQRFTTLPLGSSGNTSPLPGTGIYWGLIGRF